MTDLRTAAQQALEALAIGQDAAHEVAQTYHEAMAGYRPARHIAVDDDVRKIEDAITALRAGLAEPPLYTAPPQRKPPATIDEIFDRMNKVPKGVFYGHDPMTIWMEAWRAAEQHGIKDA